MMILVQLPPHQAQEGDAPVSLSPRTFDGEN